MKIWKEPVGGGDRANQNLDSRQSRHFVHWGGFAQIHGVSPPRRSAVNHMRRPGIGGLVKVGARESGSMGGSEASIRRSEEPPKTSKGTRLDPRGSIGTGDDPEKDRNPKCWRDNQQLACGRQEGGSQGTNFDCPYGPNFLGQDGGDLQSSALRELHQGDVQPPLQDEGGGRGRDEHGVRGGYSS